MTFAPPSFHSRRGMPMASEIIQIIKSRIGEEFDGECHLTEAEARQVAERIEALEHKVAALEAVTPEMIAAAWATWHSRHGGKLGPGPAFVEAINAALAILALKSAPAPVADPKPFVFKDPVRQAEWDRQRKERGE